MALVYTFHGHACFTLAAGDTAVLFDPFLTGNPVARVTPDDVAASHIIVSHGHYDHLDVATLSKLHGKFAPRVITPLGNDLTMKDADAAIRADAFDWEAVPNPCGPGGCTGMPGGAALVGINTTEHPEAVARVMEYHRAYELYRHDIEFNEPAL